MQDFGHELTSRVAASQRALEAEGAAPLLGTPDMIRRKRAIRHGATAALAVVALGLVATTGAFASQHLNPPPASPVPSVSGEPTATISISADGPNPTIPNLGIACGDPAPVAAPGAGGFDLQVDFDNLNPSAAAEGYVNGSARVTSTNVPAVPAFALEPAVVIVRDGVVVGVNPSAGLVNAAEFADGLDLVVNDVWAVPSVVCEGATRDLEPGDYQFYVVSTVAYSPEIAALAPFVGARASGLRFPEDPLLEPGDWECAHYTTWAGEAALPDMGGPAPCLPRQNDNVGWDADTRSVVLPLPDDSASRVFSTQLIAGPFDYELSAAATAIQTEGEFVVDACDAMVRWDEDANAVSVHPRGMDRVLRDGGRTVQALVAPTFGPLGFQSRSAQIQVPDHGRAVIIAQEELASDDGTTVGVRFTVVGHAVVTLNDGDPVTVNRAFGPAEVPIDIEDVTWCGGEAPTGLAFGALSMTVFPDQLVGGNDDTPELRFYPLG